MAFAPVFPRPFAPTFDRHAAAGEEAESYYYINYNGTTTLLDGGHGASLDDLTAGDFTAEAWVKPVSFGETANGGQILSRYDNSYASGWELTFRSSSTRYEAYVKTNVGYEGGSFSPNQSADSAWHHVALTFTGASTKVLSVFIDGIKSAINLSVTGTPSAEGAGNNLCIGNLADGSRTYDGGIGWIRISDNIRYTGDFTAPSRTVPPATDGNTRLLYRLTEGSGTNVADSSGNGNTGTLANGTWSAV